MIRIIASQCDKCLVDLHALALLQTSDLRSYNQLSIAKSARPPIFHHDDALFTVATAASDQTVTYN
jgi:hypothetical protein